MAEEPLSPGKSAHGKSRILPLVALGYGIAFIDRFNVSLAPLQMNENLNFSDTAAGLGAILFLGYSVYELSASLLPCRLGALRWLAQVLVSWSILAIAMALGVHARMDALDALEPKRASDAALPTETRAIELQQEPVL